MSNQNKVKRKRKKKRSHLKGLVSDVGVGSKRKKELHEFGVSTRAGQVQGCCTRLFFCQPFFLFVWFGCVFFFSFIVVQTSEGVLISARAGVDSKS